MKGFFLRRNEAIAEEKAYQEYRNTGCKNGRPDPLIQGEIKGVPVPDEIVPFVNYSDSGMRRGILAETGTTRARILSPVRFQRREGKYLCSRMSDGVVEQIGWLKLGGYRVGIRSPKGVYFFIMRIFTVMLPESDGEQNPCGRCDWIYGRFRVWEKEGTVGRFPVHCAPWHISEKHKIWGIQSESL